MRTTTCTAIALACSAGACGGATQEQRFRDSLERSPAMRHPAGGKVDPVPSDGFMGSFRLESYSADRICFLGRANIPPGIARGVEFRLEGYRAPADYPGHAQLATTHEVEVLDSQELELRWKKIELQPIGGSHVYDMNATETDRSMFNTGLDVCFSHPQVPTQETRYLVLQTDPDDPAMQHHVVGVSWKLVAP